MAPRKLYYFDNNATTRVAPEVVEAMLPFLTESWGNPSSAYQFGKQVAAHIESARAKVAALINADPKEIVFTSCATESNNSALHNAIAANPRKRHIVTTAVEHSAILNDCHRLRRHGYEITILGVDGDGQIDLHALDQAIRPDTAIVSVMWANNETGVVFPVEEIAALCQSREVPFHTDATQVPGKIKIDVKNTGLDFLSLSGHKLHAPKGVGALYIKKRSRYEAYVLGGHQEHGKRGGTENVASIVAFGRAAEMAVAGLTEENARVRALRDRLENGILSAVSDTIRTGAKEPRLPNTSNISFDGLESESILLAFDALGICASSGSACVTGSLEPSHVLTAMGLKLSRARGCIRFSLSLYNTDEEVDFLLAQIPGIIAKLRAVTPDATVKKKRETATA